ncbi:MAG: hypothetical protein HYY40_06575 [Bacteroidetes bacterium]|nr:hypothetical protein [Bacteroidota bacterium]
MTESSGKNENLKNEILFNIRLLDAAMKNFYQNLEDARKIGIKNEYSFNELYIMDSLPSRFARISDILTQKILKELIEYLGEEIYSFIGRAKFAEKIGFVNSASILIEIRSLREDIIHEYADPTYVHVIHQVIALSDPLIEAVKKTKEYIRKNLADKS